MPPLSAFVDFQALNLAILLALGAGAVRWYRRVNATLARVDRVLVKLETTHDFIVQDHQRRLDRLEDLMTKLHTAA